MFILVTAAGIMILSLKILKIQDTKYNLYPRNFLFVTCVIFGFAIR